PVHIDGNLEDLVNEVSRSSRNVFPVIDDENVFHGLVIMDDIRHIMFKPDMYKTTFINNLMFMPSAWVDRGDTMEDVAGKFQESGKYVLPVLEDGKYIGFVSRADVFSKYRRMLKHFSDD
ncbi:MAG: CBS domain-containing protein, partial [Bacteroidota bacterium]|nr:CBS domain-containing protein [Bacteroidota bacterium]